MLLQATLSFTQTRKSFFSIELQSPLCKVPRPSSHRLAPFAPLSLVYDGLSQGQI